MTNGPYVLAVGSWLLLASVLTILRIAPEHLNADILINSVMSLQKLTLYYWGQNRLLNVLPAATSIFRNPAANLMAVLLLTALTFFALLFMLSRYAALIVDRSNINWLSLKTFVFGSGFIVLVFQPHAIVDMVIWHVEYSLPALLLSIAIWWLMVDRKRDAWSICGSCLIVFVAVGVNPAVIIVVFFVLLAWSVYNRRIDKSLMMLGSMSLSAFIFWDVVSRQYGSMPYGEFDIALLKGGVRHVVRGLVAAINVSILLSVLVALVIFRVSIFLMWRRKLVMNKSMGRYISFCILIFSIAWIAVFSMSRWVEVNQFHWRYFIVVIFALMLGLAISVTQMVDALPKRMAIVSVVLAGLGFIQMTAARPVPFEKYKIFEKADSLTESGGGLYAGDYWLVWPSVLRDMMDGHEAYGLAFRGEANGAAVRAYTRNRIDEQGGVRVACLGESAGVCVQQIQAMVGRVQADEPIRVGQEVYEIRLRN